MGVFDVGDLQLADGAALNDDKRLLRNTRLVKGPPARNRAESMGLWALSFSGESNRKSEEKRQSRIIRSPSALRPHPVSALC